MGKVVRWIIPAVLVATFIVGAPGYFLSPERNRALCAVGHHFFHANIFHLAANSLAAWCMFPDWKRMRDLPAGFVVGSLAYLFSATPVIGFSNILFSVLGIRCVRDGWVFKQPFYATGIALGLSFFIPKMAALTHLVSFAGGMLVSFIAVWVKKLSEDYGKAGGGR